MRSFNWKKLKFWKIDFYVYEVLVVNNLPKKYDEEKKNKKDYNKTVGVCDTESRKIYICRKGSEFYPDMFLEDLFHELEHAIDHSISIDAHAEIVRTTSSDDQEELFYDLRVDQRSMKRLAMIYDNISNHQYILDYFASNKAPSHGRGHKNHGRK